MVKIGVHLPKLLQN